MKCPFCNPGLDPEQKVVLANEYCYFLQKPQPVLVGSGLIVPKQHRKTRVGSSGDCFCVG